jgi:hypothetical protein
LVVLPDFVVPNLNICPGDPPFRADICVSGMNYINSGHYPASTAQA